MLIPMMVACVVALACWWMLARTAKQLRRELHIEIEKLSIALRSLEQKYGEPSSEGDGHLANISDIQIVGAKSVEPGVVLVGQSPQQAEISLEAQEAIKATLSAFLGQRIRIRSIKLLQKHDPALAWITQGRIAVQLSHNQRAARG
jgi:hypothetical protein